MKLLAPRLYCDELYSSGLVRFCHRAALPITALTSEIFGRKWTPGFFQAGHIEQAAPMFGISAQQLLRWHTVFPYATAFTEPGVHEKALANALSVGHSARGAGAVTQSVSDNVNGRRLCKRCASEELSVTGESYWHRSHNLPGVLVCLKHREMLTEVDWLPTNGQRSWSYSLPHEAVALQSAAPKGTAEDSGASGMSNTSNTSNKGRRFLNTLALRSIEALQSEYGSFAARREGWSAWYRDQLTARGLLSPGRQADGRLLAAFVERQIAGVMGDPIRAVVRAPGAGGRGSDGAEEQLGRAARGGFDFSWLQLMVRPGVVIPFIPLKHLIFQAALDVAPQDRDNELLNHSPVGYKGKARASIDAQCSAEIRRIVDDAVASGTKVSVIDALRELGVWQLYRHSSAEFPLVAAEVKRLRTSAASLRRTSMRRIATTAKKHQAMREQACIDLAGARGSQ